MVNATYLNKVAVPAAHLFQQLLADVTFPATIHVLVVGAGSFPSYRPFVNFFKKNSIRVFFTLVETSQDALQQLVHHYPELADAAIYPQDIRIFLKTTQQKFDLIYFEHPEVMTLPLVLAVCGVSALKRVIHLRDAFFDYARVLKNNSIIFASCMSLHETYQLKHLLKYTLGLPAICYGKKGLKNFFYHGPYGSGLLAKYRHTQINFPCKKKRALRRSHYYLCLFLFLAILLYIYFSWLYPEPQYIWQRLLQIILMAGQFYLHRPGFRGLITKFSLLFLQIALFFAMA